MQTKMNWVGIAGGVTTIGLIIISLFSPWWHIIVGEHLIEASVSPLSTNLNFLGSTFTIPLLWALNLMCLLSLVASGIAMLVYSIIPTNPHSKHLLGFAYKKPLFTLLLFIIALFALTQTINAIFSINVPLIGSATATLPETMTYGATLNVIISAEFQWPFWVGAVAAGLCITAKLYHKRITTTQLSSIRTTSSNPTAS
jgi:hypothetical protein